MLQLRVSYFEYFKIEPSTDFNSPSQCQHQHHHSYFVKMGIHKFNSGRVSIAPVMLIRCLRMGMESFFLVKKHSFGNHQQSQTSIQQYQQKYPKYHVSSSSRPSSSSSSSSSSYTSSSSSIHPHHSTGISSASVMTTQPADAIAGIKTCGFISVFRFSSLILILI